MNQNTIGNSIKHKAFDDMINRISDGYLLLDSEMKVLLINHSAELFFNKKSSDVIGKHVIHEAISLAKGTVFESTFSKLFEGNTDKILEYYFEVESHDRCYEVTVNPFNEGVSLLFKEQVNNCIIKGENTDNFVLYKESQGLSKIGYWDLNPESGELLCSNEVYEIFELEHESLEITLDVLKRFTSKEDWLKLKNIFFRVCESGSPFELEFEIKTKSEKVKYLFATGNCSLYRHGYPKKIIGTIQDITEIQRNKSKSQTSEKKFETLFETLTEGVVFQNSSGEITDANPAAEGLLGLSLDQLIGRTSTDPRWKAFTENGEDYTGELHPAMKALKSGKIIRNEIMKVFNPIEQRLIWLLVSAIPLFHNNSKVPDEVYTIFRDISDIKEKDESLKLGYNATLNLIEDLSMEINVRKRIETKLRDSEKILIKSQEIGGTGSIVWEKESKRLILSKNLYSMLEINESKEAHNFKDVIFNFIHKIERKRVIDEHRKMVLLKKCWPIELFFITINNNKRYFRLIPEFQFNQYSEVEKSIIVIHDITEQKIIEKNLQNSYDQLRLFTSNLQNIREEERKMISRELHDEMGHVLSALNINLSYFERELKSEDILTKKDDLINEISNMRVRIDSSIRNLKKLITKLRPEVLEHLPIDAALEWLINDFSNNEELKVNYSSPLVDYNLDKQRSLVIFRILQEALSNARKYSQADNIFIEFYEADNNLELKIEDDGVGFDMDDIKDKSFGLIGMRERADYIGGTFKLSSKKNKGTKIEVVIPLEG
jgi:PAS domain S-box-containing protein